VRFIFSSIVSLLIRVFIMITRAYEYDRLQEDKILQTQKSCILSNKRNIVAHRDHSNQLRRDGRIRKAQEHQTNLHTFEEIEDEIAAELEARKASQAYTKELHEKKKVLQASTGIKRRRNPTKATKGKVVMLLEPVTSLETEKQELQGLNEVSDLDTGLNMSQELDDASMGGLETTGFGIEEVDGGLTVPNPIDHLVDLDADNRKQTLTGHNAANLPVTNPTPTDAESQMTLSVQGPQMPPTLSVHEPLEPLPASAPDPTPGTEAGSSLLGRSQRIRTAPKTFGEAATTDFSEVDMPKRPRKRRPQKQRKNRTKDQ
jgi:hypothetical protein